jgi:hypothetical protein
MGNYKKPELDLHPDLDPDLMVKIPVPDPTKSPYQQYCGHPAIITFCSDII